MEEIKMKKKASKVVKQMIAAVSSIAKAKTLALKNKTRAIKTRIIIFSLLWNNKSVMSSISHKLHALLGQRHAYTNNNNLRDDQKQYVKSHDDHIHGGEEDDDHHQDQTKDKSALLVDACTTTSKSVMTDPEDIYNLHAWHHGAHEPHDDDGYLVEGAGSGDHHDRIDPDAQKYPDLTHSLFDSDDEFGSVIDIVKNSKQEAGQDFSLEDEIDHVADLFIRRFHHQIRIQKQHSLKRHQKEEMFIHSGA